MTLIHITATYSNAVLMAVLPLVSDFAKKLEVPISQPIAASQVQWFRFEPYKEEIDGGLLLTNSYWFHVCWKGYVAEYRAPHDWFFEQDPAANASRYVGKSVMTTNSALELARAALHKLGYEPEAIHAAGKPQSVEGPYRIDLGEIPFCRFTWEAPDSPDPQENKWKDRVQVAIDMANKTVVELNVMSTNVWREPPKVDVVPELQSDYLKRTRGKDGQMFIRTNAPPQLPSNAPTIRR